MLEKLKNLFKKEEVKNSVQPVYKMSEFTNIITCIGNAVHWIYNKVQGEKGGFANTLRLHDINTVTLFGKKLCTFSLETSLGVRNVIITRTINECKVDYLNENGEYLVQIIETQKHETDLPLVSLGHLNENCNWTAESILLAIYEIYDIVLGEYDRIFNRYNNVEKELDILLKQDDPYKTLLGGKQTRREKAKEILGRMEC